MSYQDALLHHNAALLHYYALQAAANNPDAMGYGGSVHVFLVTLACMVAAYVLVAAGIAVLQAMEPIEAGEGNAALGIIVIGGSFLAVQFLLPWIMMLVQHLAVGGDYGDAATNAYNAYFSAAHNSEAFNSEAALWGRYATWFFYVVGVFNVYGVLGRLVWLIMQF